MQLTTTKVIDTVTRRSSGIRCTLVETPRGFVVQYKVGAKRGVTEPMSRTEAATMWDGLRRVGVAS